MSSLPTGTLARDVVDPTDTSVNSGAGTPPYSGPAWGPRALLGPALRGD